MLSYFILEYFFNNILKDKNTLYAKLVSNINPVCRQRPFHFISSHIKCLTCKSRKIGFSKGYRYSTISDKLIFLSETWSSLVDSNYWRKVSIYLSIFVSIFLCVSFSVHLYLFLSIYIKIYKSLYLLIFLSIHLFINPSFFCFIYLSIIL